uniref:Transposase n=1 Tax=Ascaris lumbricoides TaxID=6252 RepID=A0A0M3IWK1_ASCLU
MALDDLSTWALRDGVVTEGFICTYDVEIIENNAPFADVALQGRQRGDATADYPEQTRDTVCIHSSKNYF